MEVGLKELAVMFVGTGLVGVCGALLRVWQRMAVLENEMNHTGEERKEYRARTQQEIGAVEARLGQRITKFQEETASEIAQLMQSIEAMREEIHEIKIMVSELKIKGGH